MFHYCLAEYEVLRCFATSSALSSLISMGKMITAADMNDEELPGNSTWLYSRKAEEEKKQVPSCSRKTASAQ